MDDVSIRGGIELRLSALPLGLCDRALKTKLVEHLDHITYDFIVVLESYSEELVWQLFDGSRITTNTARVTIPDSDEGSNPGTKLIGTSIEILHDREFFTVKVSKISDSTTTQSKYREIRKRKPPLNSIESIALSDGIIGDVCEVSCGTFDLKNKFEATHVWSSERLSKFDKFSYFGDAWPKKFQICLTESGEGKSLEWEWMDLHTSNIRGLIFEESNVKSQRVVYFVVDKPPQFYQRTQVKFSAETLATPESRSSIVHTDGSGTTFVHSRILHPSSIRQDPNMVGNMPWIVQYSRVFRVVYQEQQDFSLATYESRLSRREKDTLFCFHHPQVARSERTLEDMTCTLMENTAKLREFHSLQEYPESFLTALKLLYNCNISAVSAEATSVLETILERYKDIRLRWPLERRRLSEALLQSARDMETSHLRALRRFHVSLHDNDRKLPGALVRNTIEPLNAILSRVDDGVIDDAGVWSTVPPVVFEIVIYPSHSEMRGPITPINNSIMEKYRDKIDRFLRVRFADNHERPFKVEADTNPESIIENRVFRVLNNGIQMLVGGNRPYEFLGYSLSGLKNRKTVWFLRNDSDGLNSKTIRDTIGDWSDPRNHDLAHKPSKWGGRLALAFAESVPVTRLSRQEWSWRDDEGSDHKFPNTDGCGLINLGLCDSINDRLSSFGFKTSQAFQIRFGGFKGVVYSGAESLIESAKGSKTGLKMLLRESQLKFYAPEADEMTLRIVSTAADGHPSLFFTSLMKVLEDSGAEIAEIEKIYSTTYRNLTTLSNSIIDILRDIYKISDDSREDGMKARFGLLKLAIHLQKDGIHPQDYSKSYLALYLTKLAERACDTDLFKIPIPGSYSALGLTDDYKILRTKEVYIRARGEILTGPVLLYRYPIIHVGDIQMATAISDEDVEARTENLQDKSDRLTALQRMNNVIFFSQDDSPPLPNTLAGGDLDGDRFEILTKRCLFWGDRYETSDPDNYAAEPQSKADTCIKPFDSEELAKFLGQYVRNDCFAELQDRLMCLAHQKPTGMKDPDVKDLAKWLSQAVDYAKNGVKVDLAEDVTKHARFKVGSKPDFLRPFNRRPFYDAKGEYYESPGLLGRIHKRIKKVRFTVPKSIDNARLQERIAVLWNERLNSSPDFLKIKNVLQGFLERRVKLEVDSYREYLEMHDVSEDAEIEIFVSRTLDGFPDEHLRSLIGGILRILGMAGILRGKRKFLEDEFGFDRFGYACGTNYNPETVEQIFRTCLFQAW